MTAGLGAAGLSLAGEAFAATEIFPVKVDSTLFKDINRAKNPAKETGLEELHVPVIKAPSKVTAGEPFMVEISVGEKPHPMMQAHYIEFIELNIGNEPAGVANLNSMGYVRPKVSFSIVLTKESAPGGKATLVAHERCNIHGYWEGTKDIEVV